MKTDHEYQPEDIEALLAEKPFGQLYEEEKRFVLEHLSSAEEYERMREMLLSIRGAAGEDDSAGTFRPSERVKRELMEEFSREQRRRRALWWNSIGAWLRNSLRLDLPIVRIAFATVLLLLGVWTVFKIAGNKNETGTAQQSPAPAQQDAVQPPANLLSNNNATANSVDTSAKTQPENASQRAGVNHDAQNNGSNAVVNANNNQPNNVQGNNIQENNIQANNNQANNAAQQIVVTNKVQQGSQARTDSVLAVKSDALANNVTFDMQHHGDSATIVPANSVSTAVSTGTTISLTANGGSTYSWDPGTNAATNLSVTNSYTTNATGGNGVNGSYTNFVDPLTGSVKSRTLAADGKVISAFYELR